MGCSEKKTNPSQVVLHKNYAEELVHVNKKLVDKESRDIDNWLKRHNTTALETGTGLRYIVLKKGSGNKAQKGQWATINYSIYLLDGTLCYESKKSQPEKFLIEQDYVESGLHEGIQLMEVGSKYILIMPKHLAHGLLGDDKKIPPLSTIIYEVELIKLQDHP